jgi:hypothetical protein
LSSFRQAIEVRLGQILDTTSKEVESLTSYSEGLAEREDVLKAYNSREFWQFALEHAREIEGLVKQRRAQAEREREQEAREGALVRLKEYVERKRAELDMLRVTHAVVGPRSGDRGQEEEGGGEGEGEGTGVRGIGVGLLRERELEVERREKAVVEEERRVRGERGDVEEARREVMDREGSLEEEEERVERKRRECVLREENIKAKLMEAAEREGMLRRREEKLVGLEAGVEDKASDVKRREAAVDEGEESLRRKVEAYQRIHSEMDAELRAWEEELELREQTLQSKGGSPLLARRRVGILARYR